VTFEWDARKAPANLKRHGVAFADAATVFLDPLATTFPDPDRFLDERREVTIGHTMKGALVLVAHCERVGTGSELLARVGRREPSASNMKKEPMAKRNDVGVQFGDRHEVSAATGGLFSVASRRGNSSPVPELAERPLSPH
jgi:uncharacterized DUF497 family protein